MHSLVTVVIPAYNAADFLQKTIDSALGQTYENLEILIIDDGSTDATGEIGRAIAQRVTKVKYLHKPNGGVASARNFGIEKAGGAYVAFLDADDLWHPSKIASQVAALKGDRGEQCRACFSLHRKIDSDDRLLLDGPFWPSVDFTLSSHIVIHPVGNGSSLLVERAVALEVGGFDETYIRYNAGGCEDLDFELKIAAMYPIRCVPEHHIGYRVYDGNMSSNRLSMARAFSMVAERHVAANPSLSGFCKKQCLSKAYAYSADNLMSRLQFAATVTYAYKLLKTDYIRFLYLLADHWPKVVLRRLTASFRKQFGIQTIKVLQPLFFEIDPKSRSVDDTWEKRLQLFQKLSLEDVVHTPDGKRHAREDKHSLSQV